MNWFKYNKSPIIVIGMHRSGTSMFTRVLEACGVFMGADLSANQESFTFTHFNEKLLNEVGSSWNKPQSVKANNSLGFDQGEFPMQFLHYKREPMNVIRFLMGRTWGWKDPRNTFTLPYWIGKYFPEARIIHVYRNGIDVAKSLQTRNEDLSGIERIQNLSDDVQCFRLWETYVEEAFNLQVILKKPVLHISYEDLISTNSSCISQIEDFLRIKNLKRSLEKIAIRTTARNDIEIPEPLREASLQSKWMKELGYLK